MPDAAWQASSTYLTAFIASLRHLNQFEKVHAAVEPDARAMLDNPRSQRWWSGPVFASVMVTHDVRGAFRTADRLALLTGGKIVQQGTQEEFLKSNNPKVQEFLERDFPDATFAA